MDVQAVKKKQQTTRLTYYYNNVFISLNYFNINYFYSIICNLNEIYFHNRKYFLI